MDIMNIEAKIVLQMVDKDNLINSAIFLSDGESTNEVWKAYLKAWVNPYIGYYKAVHKYQGPQIVS